MLSRLAFLAGAAVLLSTSGCSSNDVAAETADRPGSVPTADPTLGSRSLITVQATATGLPIDARLFGTNIPAWVNPSQLGNDKVRAATSALGTTLLRLPGGSWSNHYDWLKCEMGDTNGCFWTWASKPTDFLKFLRATRAEGMWTVSFNGTAKEAAALVAFFNGAVNDTTVIGVDVRGRDWKRVRDWAQLRATTGNPAPYRIKLWEVGNEVYGAKPAFGGSNCISWGWEEVWTCDGNEYMLGKGSGSTRREGYLDFRAEMRKVDPTIMVGAVGVDKPGEWSNWGTKVIEKGGANLDFYIIHNYVTSQQPPNAASVLPAAQLMWKESLTSTNAAFDRILGRRIPIAVTEYNLAAFQDLDNAQLMTRAVNALLIADIIGQLAAGGVSIANQWNLANGRANNGTDYGLIDGETARRAPQYYALKLWSSVGSTLVPLTSPLPDQTTLSAYATRAADGSLSILAINKSGAPIDVRLALQGVTRAMRVSADVMTAESLEAQEVTYNGNANPAIDFSNAPSQALGEATGSFDHTFPKYSLTVLRFKP
ncbi:MAG: hypothetical protein U5K74_11925 [Gemmatimonadaceae bacterium]|nr:hypothetical protein [Gemmatimonadaceae bacterium]